jgi:hypothetical protein
MAEDLASFRELKGISEAAEGMLHSAEVRTWRQLSQILAAVTRMPRISAGDLRHLAREAAERAEVVDENGERRHSFVVHLSLDKDGVPARSSIVDTRSPDQPARQWPGWRPDELVDMIELISGIEAQPPAAIADMTPTDVAVIHAVTTVVADGEPGPEIETVSATQTPRDLASLDIGLAAGGRRSTREFVIRSLQAPTDDDRPYAYRAALSSRPIGEARAHLLAEIGGSTRFEEDLRLRFVDVELPKGLQRLTLTIRLRPAGPALELIAS